MSETVSQRTRSERDPRLDFFRGLGMFIITIAHIPFNNWASWIPARFGFSDAADIFVFCSGMASALAFGAIFVRAGWWMGTARILHRIWQVYWAHIGSFFVVAGMLAACSAWFGDEYFLHAIELDRYFDAARSRVWQTLVLAYNPPYFEILPMYLTILAMIPLVMALARVHVALVFGFMALMWVLANFADVNFSAQPEGGRRWFFNPFGWQLVFFTGFAFMRGWLPAPPRDRRVLAAAILMLLMAAPFSCTQGFSCYQLWGTWPVAGDVLYALGPFTQKTSYGLLRYVYFLAVAYVAWYAAGERGRHLSGRFVAIMRRVGQQTLAVFLTSLCVAQIAGIYIRMAGGSAQAVLLGNLGALACLVAAAYVVHWFKSSPWHAGARKTQPVAGENAGAPGRAVPPDGSASAVPI